MTIRRMFAVVLIGVILGTSCSSPVDQEVQALSLEAEAEQYLVFGTPRTSSTTLQDTDEGEPYALYYVVDDNLQKVIRRYPDPPGINDLLGELSQPSDEEIDEFARDDQTLESKIPANLNATLLKSEDPESTVAVVRVDAAGTLKDSLINQPGDARLILGQLVCTLLRNTSPADSVEFLQRSEEGESEPLALIDIRATDIQGARATASDYDCDSDAESDSETGDG